VAPALAVLHADAAYVHSKIHTPEKNCETKELARFQIEDEGNLFLIIYGQKCPSRRLGGVETGKGTTSSRVAHALPYFVIPNRSERPVRNLLCRVPHPCVLCKGGNDAVGTSITRLDRFRHHVMPGAPSLRSSQGWERCCRHEHNQIRQIPSSCDAGCPILAFFARVGTMLPTQVSIWWRQDRKWARSTRPPPSAPFLARLLREKWGMSDRSAALWHGIRHHLML
jgi:hypothetical protein